MTHPKRAFFSLQIILGAWGDMFSSEQLCFELGASMFPSNGSHEGPWNCHMQPRVMCQKEDRPWKDPKTSTALRMCLRWERTKASSLSCIKPGAAITTGTLSLTLTATTPTSADAEHSCTQLQECQTWTSVCIKTWLVQSSTRYF